MRYLVDSVILIDHFNGIDPATEFLTAHGSECALSVISRAETLAGFDGDGHTIACELLDLFPTLPLTTDIADRAAALRHGAHWKLPEALQAAFALEHELTLVTRNTRDFGSCTEPSIRIPYQL